jgi:serine/threonine protein kinase
MADQFERYKILDRVGGGAVEVYRARDMRAGRTVFLKVLPADLDPATRRQLLEQAQRVITLSHPYIATLYEAGDDEGVFLACEFVAGQTLTTLFADGPLNPRRAIDISTQIADALADAHARGIVHGDLDTDTVMVTPKGHAKVLDFGLTAWTRRLGQPGVASEPGERDDIAAVGRILFHALTGRTADAGPLTPSAVNRSVPRELDPIVIKAIGRSGEARYESAGALAAELRAVGTTLDDRAAAAASVQLISGSGTRKRAPVWALAVLIVLVAIAGVTWWLF